MDILCCVLLVPASAATAATASAASQFGAQGLRKKVFVTDGKDMPLTGVCVFFIRANNFKAITSENIHRVSPFKTNIYLLYQGKERLICNLKESKMC